MFSLYCTVLYYICCAGA